MKKKLSLLLVSFLLAGCGSKPAPAWLATGHKQLETYKQDFLSGRDPVVAEAHFKKAIGEIKKTGDLNLLSKALLTRIALQIAVLDAAEEGDYLKVEAVQPVAENRNFHLFLKGNMAAVDGTILPAQYRPFLTALRSGDADRAGKTIAAIEDPLSRLIAAGIAVNQRLESEAILQTAVDTASRNGWKRGLLIWLGRLTGFYEAANETAKAASVRQRIGLIEK